MTGYHQDIEPGIPDKRKIIQAVKQLSEKIGKERVIIRYDPILLSPRYQPVYHEKAFASLCDQLQGYVDTYIISFVDLYKNTRKNAARIQLREMTESQMTEIGKRIEQVASRYQVHVQTCAEQIDLHAYGITKGLCIGRDDLKRRLDKTSAFRSAKASEIPAAVCQQWILAIITPARTTAHIVTPIMMKSASEKICGNMIQKFGLDRTYSRRRSHCDTKRQ